MADIQCLNSDKTENSLTVRMTNLQTDYTGELRRVQWYYVVANLNKEPEEMTGYIYSDISYLYDSSLTQGDHTIEGLDAGTTYYIQAKVVGNTTGNVLAICYGTATTLGTGFEYAYIKQISDYSEPTYCNVTLAVRDVNKKLTNNTPYTFNWAVYKFNTESKTFGEREFKGFKIYNTIPSNIEFTITKLDCETTYLITCDILDGSETEVANLAREIETPAPLPDLSEYSIVPKPGTNKEFVASWRTFNYNIVEYYVIYIAYHEDFGDYCYYGDNLDEMPPEAILAQGDSIQEYNTININCSALSAGEYSIAIALLPHNPEQFRQVLIKITIDETGSIIPWSWEATEQRQTALYALENNGNIEDFKYQVWNDLVDKVMEAINTDTVNGIEWYTSTNGGNTTYLSYDATRMTDSDRYITAARFNALKFNIGCREGASYIDPSTQSTMTGTGISDVSKGDIIYGWYFIRLTESLNNWINSL